MKDQIFSDAVRKQLDRVLESADFSKSPRSKEFIHFVVEETLEGREQQLSQRSIASNVYGRDEWFDPSLDPVVRMQAGRVRQHLNDYFRTAGADDPIVIALPKGHYVPNFSLRHSLEDNNPGWPTLLIQPFLNLVNREETELIALGFPSDLAVELDRYTDIQVFMPPSPVSAATGCPARFVLKGVVGMHGDELQVVVHLLDWVSQKQIWAHRFQFTSIEQCEAEKLRTAQKVAAIIADERGVVSRWMGRELTQNNNTVFGAYEAILCFYRYEQNPLEENFSLALSKLQAAVTSAPDCGLCWSFLARLWGIAWSLGLLGDAVSTREILEAARKGVNADPSNVRTRLVLSFIHLVFDQMDECRAEVETALDMIGSDYGIGMDAAGYMLILSGDWSRGSEMIRKSIGTSPYCRMIVYSALWLDAIKRKDYEEAIEQAFSYEAPGLFWEPLMRAVALALAGRKEDAQEEGQRLLQWSPDFMQRGRWYIGRYIKFPDLVEQVVEGLRIAGVKLSGEGVL